VANTSFHWQKTCLAQHAATGGTKQTDRQARTHTLSEQHLFNIYTSHCFKTCSSVTAYQYVQFVVASVERSSSRLRRVSHGSYDLHIIMNQHLARSKNSKTQQFNIFALSHFHFAHVIQTAQSQSVLHWQEQTC